MNPAGMLAAITLAVAPVPVEHAPCPAAATEYAGCYYPPPTDLIYVDPDLDPDTQDIIMWHERGHAADWHFLTVGERHRFTCLPATRTMDEDSSRCGHPWGPVMREIWADAYASCHFRNLPGRGLDQWVGDTNFWPRTNRRQVNACRFIARAIR